MLGKWEEAARDLHVASKLDYDEEINSMLKKVDKFCDGSAGEVSILNYKLQVEPNAHKIEEHRRKYERLRRDREGRKMERTRQRQRDEVKVVSFSHL